MVLELLNRGGELLLLCRGKAVILLDLAEQAEHRIKGVTTAGIWNRVPLTKTPNGFSCPTTSLPSTTVSSIGVRRR